MLPFGEFSQDLAYFALSLLSDVFLIMAGALIAAGFLYGLAMVTIFMFRREDD